MTRAASLPPTTAEGALRTTPLAQLFAHAFDKQLTGTLQLDTDAGTVGTVVLREGWPFKAQTNEPHYLGIALRALGIIDDTQLNASLARLAKERKPHGQILLEMGIVTREGLQRGLKAQLAAKIEPLFGLGPATLFRYYDSVDALASWSDAEAAPADPLPILWAALQRWPPWPHVDALLGRAPPDVGLRVRGSVELARFRFAKPVADLVEVMRHTPLTLEEMARAGALDRSATRLLAYCLLLGKQITFVAHETHAPTAPPARGYIATPGPGPTPISAPPHAAAHASSQTPGQSWSAGILEERETTWARANLHGPSPRTPSQAPPAIREVRHGSAPPPGVALTPELAGFRQQIIDRVATIGDEDYFQVLGLPRDASPAVVQQTYIALAKTWHPDRLAPQLFDVRDLSEKVFTRMTEARTVLTDPDKRAAYTASLRHGVRPDFRPGAPVVNAAFEFQKAEVFFRKRNLPDAIEACRRAREADPANAEYLALLTWLEIEKEGGASANMTKHLEALDRAIKLNERCERAYLYRAALYKRMNKPDKAYLDYKAAHEINPGNIDAAREVRLYRRK